MARLPQPGGDVSNWGEILNDFLSQSHTGDGTLKPDSVGAPQIKSQSVTNAALVDGTIQEVKLSNDVVGKLNTGPQAISAITSLQSALDDKVDKTELATHAMGYIVHGSVASTARPIGYSCVTWAGSVQPINAVLNDIWIYKA